MSKGNIMNKITKLILFFTIFVNQLYSYSCDAPKNILSLNDVLYSQEITVPVVDGYSGGDEFFYEINLESVGEFTLEAQKDLYHHDENSNEMVSLVGELYDSDCNLIETISSVGSDPTLFKIDKNDLAIGKYFLKTYSFFNANDDSSDYATGYFQIQTTFVSSTPTYSINVTKDSNKGEVDPNENVDFTITVENDSDEVVSKVVVVDTVPNYLSYIDEPHSGWKSCSQSENKITCELDGSLLANSSKSITLKMKADEITDDKSVVNLVDCDVVFSDGTTKSDSASKSITVNGIYHHMNIYIVPRNIDGDEVDKVIIGHKIYYEIYLINDGNTNESNLHVIGDIPNELILDSFSHVDDWDCSASVLGKGGKIDCKFKNTTLNINADTYFKAWIQGDEEKDDVTVGVTVTSDADTDNDSSTIRVEAPKPSVYIEKDIANNDSSVKSNDSFAYSFYVENDGSENIDNIKVTDVFDSTFSIPTDWDQSGADWDCSMSGYTLSCIHSAVLHSGDDLYFEINVQAPSVNENVTIFNRADVEASSDGVVVKDDSNVTIEIIAPAPNLIIKKSVSKSKVIENEVFTYNIRIHNDGDALDKDINVTDSIPSELSIQGVSGGSWSCSYSDQNVLCKLPTLDANRYADDINISVKAPSSISDSKTVKNTAYVKSYFNDPNDRKSRSSVDVRLLSSEDSLTITKESIPSTVYFGDSYKYEIVVTNNSESEIDTIELVDKLPSEVKYESYNSDFDVVEQDLTTNTFSMKNENRLQSGESKKIVFNVMAPNYETNITNSVKMTTSMNSLQREANATTIVKARSVNLIFVKAETSVDPAKVNEEFIYTVAIKNEATDEDHNMEATDVNVSIKLDDNISFVSTNAIGWNCSNSGQIVICSFDGALVAGAISSDINVTVKGVREAWTISEANISANEISSVVKQEIGVDVKEVVESDLSISIKDDRDPVDAGDRYNYNIVVQNPNTSKAVDDLVVKIETISTNNYDLIDYGDKNDWNCWQDDKMTTCLLKNPLDPSSSKSLELEINAPNINTTVEVNATVDSEFVHDVNVMNNSATERTTIEDSDYTGDNPRDFTKVVIDGKQDINIFGDIITIGNQSICEQKVSGTCNEPSFFVNDLVDQRYINIDSDPLLQNSTKAYLNIDSTDEVIWAGLYWMGRIDKMQLEYEDKIKNSKKVLLRHSSDKLYETYYAAKDAEAIDINGTKINVDKFNYINSSEYFDYQGMQDVTEYVKEHRDGDYYVANVQSSEGENLSAGWNLVVIVRDNQAVPTKSLKNITVFDGFQGVWKASDGSVNKYPNEITQEVSGFLTPLDGTINSKLIFFGFEGDKTLYDHISITDGSGIEHELTDSQNPSNDVVNGTIFSSNRFPSLSNTSGIDIDMFDVSPIMNNNQTSTKITIGSNGDRFFLGMFSFSTDLYETMCYMQTFKDSDFSATLDASSDLHLGDAIGIEAEIRYQEIYKIDDVKAISIIDKVFKEDNSSFELKNVSETSFTKQDELFKFSTTDQNSTEVTANIGIGATELQGGYFDNKQSTYFRYTAILDQLPPDSNMTNNIYMINYGGSDKEIMLKPCSDFNQSLKVKENITNGFNVTRYLENNFDNDGDGVDDRLQRDDLNISANHLYTQVQNIGFKTSIISLDRSEYKNGLVKLEVVETNSSSVCENMSLIDSVGIINMDADIVNVDDILIHNAHKELTFRVSYPVDAHGRYVTWESASDSLEYLKKMVENANYSPARCEKECDSSLSSCQECVFSEKGKGGLSRVSCSKDIFSVKPNRVTMDLNGTLPYIGGRVYSLNFDANSSYYDQNITNSSGGLDYNLSNPVGCSISDSGNLLNSNVIEFKSGIGGLSNFTYNNVGDIEISFKDSDWTKYDQNITNPLKSDCVIGSDLNSVDSEGKVGCNIGSKKLFSFKLAKFSSKLALKGFKGGVFTYLSQDKEMASDMNITIQAILDNGNKATNYTKGCFANDIEYSFDINDTTLKTKKRFFDKDSFKKSEGNFTNGEINFISGVNFDRNSSVAQNPFILKHDMINFKVVEKLDANVSGTDFALGSDGNVTYYYARLYAPDYMGIDLNEKDVTLFYEVYCNSCDKTKFGLNGLYESKDYIDWLIFNSKHLDASFGTYSGEKSVNKLDVSNKNNTAITLKLGVLKAPYCDKILVSPSSWLMYRKFSINPNPLTSFKSCFVSNGGWAGKGKVGHIVDTNVSIKENKSIDW
jgi:uncharacterized repeat protein (TIGR01451 family)